MQILHLLLVVVIVLLGQFIVNMTLWLTTILLGAVLFLLIKFVKDRMQKQRRFKEIGIPGPSPSLLWGNLHEIQTMGLEPMLLKWHEQYGKTYGYYEGERAVLVTSDVNLIKQVFVKDFSSFHSRQHIPSVRSINSSMLNARGSDWKRLRMISNPTFSAKKMKEMSPLISNLVTSLMGVFEERAEQGESFDILNDFQCLTVSVIACCGFGLDIDAMKDPENIFLVKCRALINQTGKPTFLQRWVTRAFIIMPGLKAILGAFTSSSSGIEWFVDTSKAIIQLRKESKEKRNDFIQLMLNVEQIDDLKDISELEVRVENDMMTNNNPKPSRTTTESKGKNKGMTLEEMQGQCILFLLAGYQTSSTSLAYAAYELTMHQDIQRKLQKEIDEHLPGEVLHDYTLLKKIPYLDMVFNEALRLHVSVLGLTNRECNQDCVVGGIPLMKGDIVQMFGNMVHLDQELWGPEDPKNFVPERFLPERKSNRHSMAWSPFGVGPRNCIGMRFALMEAKMCLAMMLKKFNLVRTEQTPSQIEKAKFGVARPVDGIWIKLEKRF